MNKCLFYEKYHWLIYVIYIIYTVMIIELLLGFIRYSNMT